MAIFFRSLLFLFPLPFLLFLSCSKIPFKTGAPVPALMVSPEQRMILGRLEKRRSSFRSLRAVVKATFESRFKTKRFKLVILNQENRKVRVETLSPLDQPLYVLVLTEERLEIFDVSDGSITREKFYPESKIAFHDLILQGSLMLTLFSANIENREYQFLESPKEEMDPWTIFLKDEEESIYRVRTGEGGDYPEEIVKLNKEEKIHTEILFNSYLTNQKYPQPEEILIRFRPQKVTAHLVFQELEMLDSLDDSLFELGGTTESRNTDSLVFGSMNFGPIFPGM